MDESDYTRIACRGIAAGSLEVMVRTLDEFRFNAESAGIRVNEDVLKIKGYLDRFGQDIYQASWADRRLIRERV